MRLTWEGTQGALVRACPSKTKRGRLPTKPAPDMDTAVGNWSGMLWRLAEGQGRMELTVVPPEGQGIWHVFTLTLFSHWLGLLPGSNP